VSGDGIGNAALIALLAIVPLVVLMLTSFVKLSVVLALLRNAIGSPDAPSGLVVMGLSLVLTFFVMAPVGVDMIRAASGAASTGQGTAPTPTPKGMTPPGANAPKPVDPYAPASGSNAPVANGSNAPVTNGSNAPVANGSNAPVANGPGVPAPNGQQQVPAPDVPAGTPVAAPLELEKALRQLVPAKYEKDVDAAARALEPLKGFLARHADTRDRETFVGLAGRMGRSANGDEIWVLAPAFLTTELREAFAIAVLIFVPFLVIDLVVGLGLAALGLTTTQPQTITLPLKLLLFVAVDGWRLLIDSLLRGYV